MNHWFLKTWSGLTRKKKAVYMEVEGTKETGIELFDVTGTITVLAAGTAVALTPANGVSFANMVGPDRRCVIDEVFVEVAGATAWSGGSMTLLHIKDTNASPVTVFTVPVAALTGNSVSGMWTATSGMVRTFITRRTKTTQGKGLVVIADANAGAGSDVNVRVIGKIVPA